MAHRGEALARRLQRHVADQVLQQHGAAAPLPARLQDEGEAADLLLHRLGEGDVVELGIVALHEVQAGLAEIAEVADLQLAEGLQRAQRNDAGLQAGEEGQ